MKRNYKIYLFIGLAILVLAVLSLLLYFRKDLIPYSTLTATDNSFTVKFPSNISYQLNNKENNDFVIDLFSNQEEMFFYANRIEKIRSLDLYEVATNDKENYLEEKENVREDSGLVKTDLENYAAYEYSFVHSDGSYGKDFYTYIVWIETQNNLYVLNFEVTHANLEKYKDIFLNIKNSFVEL